MKLCEENILCSFLPSNFDRLKTTPGKILVLLWLVKLCSEGLYQPCLPIQPNRIAPPPSLIAYNKLCELQVDTLSGHPIHSTLAFSCACVFVLPSVSFCSSEINPWNNAKCGGQGPFPHFSYVFFHGLIYARQAFIPKLKHQPVEVF